jgi:hypothetical protein
MTPIQFGAYLLVERLGGGATGDTFLALSNGELRVIKRLHAELAREEEFVQRFEHEAVVAQGLASARVARVFEHGRVGDVLFIAMEYVAGWTVARIMKELVRTGAVASPEACVAVMADVLQGLAVLHAAKDAAGRSIALVHRDVAPQNLIVGTDHRARLIDLGLGKSRLGAWRTRTGRVMGSPGSMAPEQALAEPTDHRADLYSAAVVFHDLLTLEPLIPRGPVHQMLAAAANPIRRPLREARPDAPASLEPILEKALALDPARRYQSAEELLRALTEAVPVVRRELAIGSLITHMMSSELEATRADYRQRAISPVRSARWPYALLLLAPLVWMVAARERIVAPEPIPEVPDPVVAPRPLIVPRTRTPVDAGVPSPKRERRRASPQVVVVADAGVPAPPPEPDFEVRLDRTLARAQRLRRSMVGDRTAIDGIIAELLRMRFETKSERAADLDAIEAQLARLEP